MENFKKVSDKRVTEFIAWSLAAAPQWLKGYGVATAPTAVELNYAAWQLLKSTVRRDPAHRYDQDFDAAAAEHYMYIRYLASSSGDPYCHLAPTLYAAKKVFDQLLGKLQEGRTATAHPVLPANPNVLAWGQRGVTDGLADYKSVNANADYKFGGAIEALAAFSFSADKARKMGEYAQHPVGFIADQARKTVRTY